jgi:Protein of unknown function (DUF1552)
MSSHSRRRVLSMLSSIPVAASLRSLPADAAPGDIPKRVLLFFTPHGTLFDRWRPTVAGGTFTLKNILAPLQPFKEKLSIIDGLGMTAGGPAVAHQRGPAALFTGSPLAKDATFDRPSVPGDQTFGWNTTPSVDQVIADRLGAVTPYRSIELGVACMGGVPGHHISYRGPAQPMTPRQNPRQAYVDLFGGFSQTGGDAARLTKRRLSVLNGVKQDLALVKSSVASADFRKLTAQADALAEIERGLQFGVSGTCVSPTDPGEKPLTDVDFLPWQLARQMELAAAALACGLTRVASIQYRVGENDRGSQGIYRWLGQTSEHHLTSHDGSAEARAKLEEIYTWYSSQFAMLLQKLDSYKEIDGSTLLDHTMVVWGSELGTALTHDTKNVPFIVAGGGKAGLKTNQYVQLAPGGSNSRILVSLMHFMGFTDVQRFGTGDNGTGVLPALFT